MSEAGSLTFREGRSEFNGIDPRRGAKGRGEHLLIHEGPLRTTKNIFLSAEDAEGRGEHLALIRGGTRRGMENIF